MTYSSALFEEHTTDLTAAQNNKYRRLAEAIDLRPGQKLLEIGCGWGGVWGECAQHFGRRGGWASRSARNSAILHRRASRRQASATRSKSGSRIIATNASNMIGSPRSR